MPREFHDLAERQLNHESGGATAWGNFGDWQTAQTYPAACTALADQLGTRLALSARSRVMDVGFGCGDQLLHWVRHYGVRQLAGLNLSSSQTDFARQRLADAGHPNIAAALMVGSARDLVPRATAGGQARPDTVIALDCAYHFESRTRFLTDAANVLAPGGQLGVTDLVLARDTRPWRHAAALMFMTRSARIPRANLVTADTYRAQWRQAGFAEPAFVDISEQVMLPFGDWLRRYKQSLAPALRARINWRKYDATAAFMRWACRERVLRYIVCVGQKR